MALKANSLASWLHVFGVPCREGEVLRRGNEAAKAPAYREVGNKSTVLAASFI
jgi:hypothetical protein